LLDLLRGIKNIHPIIQASETGVELSLRHQKKDRPPTVKETFELIKYLMDEKGFEVLLVLDEFQEIASIPKAQHILRNCFEELTGKRSIVTLGSKAHLLQKIFSSPKSPLYQWGFFMEIKEFPLEIYHKYIQERLDLGGFFLDFEFSKLFQEKLNREPEAINKFFDYAATRENAPKKLDLKYLLETFENYVENVRSFYSELFAHFSTNERAVLVALAKNGPVANITGKDFSSKIPHLSREGLRKIASRFLDEGTFIVINEKFCINDPYFRTHLARFH